MKNEGASLTDHCGGIEIHLDPETSFIWALILKLFYTQNVDLSCVIVLML